MAVSCDQNHCSVRSRWRWRHTRADRRTASIGELGPAIYCRRSSWRRRILGTQQIVTAAPDGYTIGITNLSTLSLIPVINPEATYKPLGDFKHIAYIGGSPVVLAAHEATHAKSLDDVVAYASAPGHAFTFSSSGVGSDGHLMGVAIATALNLKPEHAPYKSTAEALTDVVAGHVPFSTSTLSSTSGFLHANTLFGIAVTSSERVPDFPDLPTFSELGHPELLDNTWFAFSGPAVRS